MRVVETGEISAEELDTAMHFRGVFFLAVVGMIGVVPVASAQSGKSLAKCEKTLAKETTKLAEGIQKAVSKCLGKIAGEVLAKGDPVSDAAKACASSFSKITNSEAPEKTLAAKFAVKVAKACDPTDPNTKADHTAAEALDPNDAAGLQAGALGAYCGEFSGDGNLDTVSEWIACADEAAVCTALQQVAVEYPRAPEWLGAIATAIAALDASEPKYTDAAGVASGFQAQIDRDMNGVADIACGPPPVASGRVLPATGQTTAYGSGSDGDIGAGAARSFTDNGDGTITDNVTRLMWEKKSDDESVHDKDRSFAWSTGSPDEMDGTITTTFLAVLNGDESGCQGSGDPDPCCTGAGAGSCDGFAGYTDWRIPNSMELYSLVNLEVVGPSTYSAFDTGCAGGCTVTTCSCTASSFYWSSSAHATSLGAAWQVYFGPGAVDLAGKSSIDKARAVRGGL